MKFHNAEFYAAAIRYAHTEMMRDTAVVNGIVHDPDVAHCALVALRYSEPDGRTAECAVLVQCEEGRLVVSTECDIADFIRNGGRRLN
jgi:hypothetical protein